MLLVSLGIRLARLFVKRKIPQDEVLPEHHNLRQLLRDDGNNRKQVLGREERLVVLFADSDFK